MRVVFSNRAYASVLAETTEKIKTETGGLFLGAYSDGTWFIVEAIDPGPKSIFEVAYFEYDQAYTQHLIRKIANLYATKLELIGLWHRHPGSFDVFSSTDDETNSKYALRSEHGAISALVNIDPDFRITMYHVNRPCRYTKIKYEVGDELFPNGLLEFKEPSVFEDLMKKISSQKNAVPQTNGEYHKSASFAGFLKTIAPYLDQHACNNIICKPALDEQEVRERLIDLLLDDLAFFAEEAGIEVTVLQREKYIIIVQEAIAGITRLYFAYSEKDGRGVFEYDGKSYFYKSGLFKEVFQEAIRGKQQRPTCEIRPADSGAAAHVRGRNGLDGLLRILVGGKTGGSGDDEQN